jgi:hypothetical protein
MSEKKNRIIVDIDNTLWDFASVLWKKVAHYGVPQPSEWRWDFYRGYFSVEQLIKYVDEVHDEQDSRYPPFADSAIFLSSLKKKGCHITIASHRNPNKRTMTESWLKTFGLVYDELYVGSDKSVLFENHQVIVDDDARTLDRAAKKGLIATGLKYAWNKNSGHALFLKLPAVLDYLNKRDCCRG